jgi:DNA-binding SARP family transcriptional activator
LLPLCYKARMEFRILGPLEVVEEGRPVELGGARQRAVLAILLTRANQVVSRDRLIDELFGEEPREAASNLVHVYVSRLRKALEPGRERRSGGSRIVTRPPGYLIRLEADELDLSRFEQLTGSARQALGAGDAAAAAASLGEALSLWRGPALADFAFDEFARNEVVRLEELRLAALEDRLDADLALGRHRLLVGELETLVDEHPLRERLRAQLMLALYRSGRQAEALDAYQDARRALVDELGIEPGAALQDLERSILRQDPELEAVPHEAAPAAPRARSIVLVPDEGTRLDDMLALARPLAVSHPPRELILSGLVHDVNELARTTAELHERRAQLATEGLMTRAAAFTSATPDEDATRLANEQDADLLLVGGGPVLAGDAPSLLALADAACDVAMLVTDWERTNAPDAGHPVLVPFGGGEHDWAALELGAWLARAHAAPLRVLGPLADPERGKRDASRLLARASLIVQQFTEVAAEPVLTPPGDRGVLEMAAEAGVVVVGLSARWREEGVGMVRTRIALGCPAPVLLVRRGLRPGGLAPAGSITRFTWSLSGEAG